MLTMMFFYSLGGNEIGDDVAKALQQKANKNLRVFV